MDLLAVTDPGWVFPAVLAFMGTGFSALALIWVRMVRASDREVEADAAKLRAITARQFPGRTGSPNATPEQSAVIQNGVDR